MRTRSKKIIAFLAVVALTAISTLALAQTPTRVGRIALIQGEVNVAGDTGDEFTPALLNWPVTTHNQLTTGRGARTEIKVGSTAIRLDGDSSMEVTELDDDTLRVHLHYGSASVFVRNAEALQGFRLSTAQGQVRLTEPGRLRVDAERVRDTTVVNVFDGVAVVEGNTASVTLRPGKRAELQFDDIRTALASRDSFDDWAYLRDQRDERVVSERYVTREMTGYEDLDQYGSWRDDREYGPLWVPRAVAVDWAPYRDGRWAWVAPWGWTWVDNAPWGYAPFHYGRWVEVNHRWCWAPGRTISRPVWAPALVGWVGGSNWQLSFGTGGSLRQAPATGWYPLSPRHTYTPNYPVSQVHLQTINRYSHPDADRHFNDGNGRDRHIPGLTVVPHAQFGQQGTVVVNNVPHAVVPAVALQTAPMVATPPAPASARQVDARWDRRNDGHDRNERPATPGVPVLIQHPQPAQPQFQQPAQPQFQPPRAQPSFQPPRAQPSFQPQQAQPGTAPRSRDEERGDRTDRNERIQRNPPVIVPQALPTYQQPQQQQPQPVAVPVQRAPNMRLDRDPEEERRHGRPAIMPSPVPAPVQMQPQQAQPQQQQPMVRPAPQPVFTPPPQQQPRAQEKKEEHPAADEDRRRRGLEKTEHQRDNGDHR